MKPIGIRNPDLGPEARHAIERWVSDQLPGLDVYRVDASGEGHVTIRRWVRGNIWFEAVNPECPTCHGASVDTGTLGRRQHIPVTTPPPWTYPCWDDQR